MSVASVDNFSLVKLFWHSRSHTLHWWRRQSLLSKPNDRICPKRYVLKSFRLKFPTQHDKYPDLRSTKTSVSSMNVLFFLLTQRPWRPWPIPAWGLLWKISFCRGIWQVIVKNVFGKFLHGVFCAAASRISWKTILERRQVCSSALSSRILFSVVVQDPRQNPAFPPSQGSLVLTVSIDNVVAVWLFLAHGDGYFLTTYCLTSRASANANFCFGAGWKDRNLRKEIQS